jgi:ubiquinone/menaquinone biosynthesis C-methylase UbiE
MVSFVLICIGLILLITLIGAGWRYSSKRFWLPCPASIRWLVELENPFAKQYHSRSIIQRLNLQSGMRVLDAGCGPGRLAIPLAQQVGPEGEVVAVDVQARMLQRAQTKAKSAGLENIRFLHMGIGSGTLDAGHFDRALLVAVLGEIRDRTTALKEIHRALKPGGILSVSETMFDPHYQRRSAILELARRAGFIEDSFAGGCFSFTLNLRKDLDAQD